ncbi:TPA: WG repeat-containing protein [Candidatus Poribacteria bacterium]|nr:WG repeat-containing protein [Candidatus Poribacteria bacterium]
MVIDPLFNQAKSFSQSLACIGVGENADLKYGYIDKTGQVIIDPLFNSARSFSEGLACAGVGEYPDTKYGYIDRMGRIAIHPQFDHGHNFSEGFALVKLEGRWGAIDINGNFLRHPEIRF